MSVPENVPVSAFIYMILARDPDPGQEVEVRGFFFFWFFFVIYLFFPTLIKKGVLKFSMSKKLNYQALNYS